MPDSFGTMLQLIIASGIGGGVGAGVVTFALNFWKGERETRRANLERLYRAVHKYINAVFLVVVFEVRQGEYDVTKDRSHIEAQVDEINVLIDLYFPRLKGIFESYRERNENFILHKDDTFRRAPTDFEKDAHQIIQDGNHFRQEIARLMHELEVYPPT